MTVFESERLARGKILSARELLAIVNSELREKRKAKREAERVRSVLIAAAGGISRFFRLGDDGPVRLAAERRMYGTFRLFRAIPRHPRCGGGSRRQTAAGPPFLGDWFRRVCSCRHSYRETRNQRNLASRRVLRIPVYRGYSLAYDFISFFSVTSPRRDTRRRESSGGLMARVNKSQANAQRQHADRSNFRKVEKVSPSLSISSLCILSSISHYIFRRSDRLRRTRNKLIRCRKINQNISFLFFRFRFFQNFYRQN